MFDLPEAAARRIVRLALEEDIGTGDLTCRLVLPSGHRSRARVVAKQSGTLCGVSLAPLVFSELGAVDPESGASEVELTLLREDGSTVAPGDEVLLLEGPTRAILEGERVFLNLAQHLSGVATQARIHQDAAGASCRVLDTRKTAPGQRELEKWAIRVGGGANNRMGLWDAVFIKENHAQAAGGVRSAALRALEKRPVGADVIVEVRSLEELDSVLDLPLTRVLLDHFAPAEVARSVALRDARGAGFPFEVSGEIRLGTLPAYASAGAEFASLGALTHSALPLDLSLLLEGT
ncbi:MAG TPA: carboxylating nicotinate-nucleotide diphosphorylase [Fibrobacteria bacterium]|nr:carboxylating nicotinate-nucleotide diphosphorylase [Fibrobacteria bacterium]